MGTTQAVFFDSLANFVKKYAKERGYHQSAVAAILAQAALESGWGRSTLSAVYYNYFGMKCGSSWTGKSVNLATKEEYTAGTLTNIVANFRVYDSIEEGIKGYFDFISTSRYATLKTATTSRMYLERIKEAGYATSSTYVTNLVNMIDTYGLERYNNFDVETKEDTWSGLGQEGLYYPACTGYTKGSIIDALKFIGVDSSLAHRKQIAAKNGITGYKGTAAQNKQLLELLKAGKLLKE